MIARVGDRSGHGGSLARQDADYTAATIDGFIADPSQSLDWLIQRNAPQRDEPRQFTGGFLAASLSDAIPPRGDAASGVAREHGRLQQFEGAKQSAGRRNLPDGIRLLPEARLLAVDVRMRAAGNVPRAQLNVYSRRACDPAHGAQRPPDASVGHEDVRRGHHAPSDALSASALLSLPPVGMSKHLGVVAPEVQMMSAFDMCVACLRSRVGLAVLLCAALALSAPSARAQKITTEFDEGVDFSRFKTFHVRDGRLNSRSPALNSELTSKRVTAEIEKALTSRGLTKADGPADLNVFFTLGTLRRVETEAYPAGWRGFGTRVVRVPYAEGTLVIDLRDPSTRSLVWRGIATEGEPSPAKLAGKLDDMVRKAIAKYPPKKK